MTGSPIPFDQTTTSASSAIPLAITTLLTIILTIAFVHKSKKNAAKYSSIPQIPGALPIIGNKLHDLERLVVQMEEWAAKHSTHNNATGLLRMNLFVTHYVLVSDDASASRLEAGRPYDVTKPPQFEDVMRSLHAGGVFAVEGEQWRKDRRIVGPSLSRKNVRDYMSSVKIVCRRLMDTLGTLRERGPVAINDLLLAVTFDVIALVACDADVDSLRRGESEMGKHLKTLIQSFNFRLLSPFSYWKIPLIGNYLDGGGFAADQLLEMYRNLIRRNEGLEEEEKPKNFLTRVLAMNKSEDPVYVMDEARLIGNIMTLFLGGTETTQVTLCSSLWEIAVDETGLQDELAREALALENFEEAELDDIMNGLPRLRSLIYEVLRIRGPTPFMVLRSMKDMEIAGVTVPSQTQFFVLWRFISTLDDVSDPERLTPLGPEHSPRKQFCPRRWLTTKEDGTLSVHTPSHKHGWRPFGVGMRVCPGRDFAEVEMLIILASILRKYEISLKEGHAPMTLVSRFTECPDIEICLVLKDRIE
mmetsp:Transcript_5500/g.10716  ORF Transcript_5500/g.10716 Transcript_5500/m.10716 type:complete len:530 (+) Transcript_5500:80-1669(+)|eukprot:CAMPEP_0171412998 /NCGR_PEP_ID=MMETSP0880-20121228/34015_1 /TAXON_ID=67004 /ORGANISM="Thalassiosira weissflogii, Strain CCMP1336" /LENGTH=529 /DNA_ID=CAMNT_0011930563 /DNA_START=8 /DNA_END=1597 /DNA_ORIENTATION=+